MRKRYELLGVEGPDPLIGVGMDASEPGPGTPYSRPTDPAPESEAP